MKYEVQVDVIMTGEIYIEAKNEREAQKIASNKYFVPSDLRNFRFLSSEAIEVLKEEEQKYIPFAEICKGNIFLSNFY